MTRIDLSTWAEAYQQTACDLLVIGGGATGLGVAVQAALEGRRVVLVEARDFAAGTSSRSTKLLHGGVRYLAQGRVRLVREALRERSVVLRLAPHLAQPLPFWVAERRWFSWGLAAVGLKAYQWLSGRHSLGSTTLTTGRALRAALPQLPGVVAGVRYWDGQFEDARLALALARTAVKAGALVRNHTRVVGLAPAEPGWAVTLQDGVTGAQTCVQARCVVNAAGVWVDPLRQMALRHLPQNEPKGSQDNKRKGSQAVPPLVQASQGVHLVVSRSTWPLDEAVLVPQTSDGRVLFAVPWMGSTVIGTTDTPRSDAPLEPRPTAEELAFLFTEVRRAFGLKLQAADVNSVWVGLRPLVGAGPTGQQAGQTSALSREHLVVREAPGFVTVTGGKWTTYRAMAEEVLLALVEARDLKPAELACSTQDHVLWGAPPAGQSVVSLRQAPGLHLWGTAAADVAALPGHAVQLGLGLTEAMVRYSARHEWAITVEDMLARRWRALFLDARTAKEMAPRVADVLREETGLDPALAPFMTLCDQYVLTPADTGAATEAKEMQP